MWTRSHTSLPTIWCDLTFPLLALVSHTAPLQNTTNMMISARGGCHLPLQSVLREGCFAYSGPFTSVLTFFSKSYWTVALFVRGVEGATKSPRPRICLPSQHAQPRNRPRWSLRPSPKDLAAAPLPARRSGWQQGCIRDTLRHTHRGLWSGCLDRLLHTHRAAWTAQPLCNATQTHRRAHSPVLFLSSRKSECRFSGEKMCALILHIQKHTQTCIVPLNVSMASKTV